MAEAASQVRTPILLLKTKSTPTDTYEEYFTASGEGQFDPMFVPVLEHRFKEDSQQKVKDLVESSSFDTRADGDFARVKYGGIIFTSQRAVEAFTQVVRDIRSKEDLNIDELLPSTLPFYVVGPATARGLRALDLQCPIVGEHTGNGDALAAFILEHYNSICQSDKPKPSLLFLVGEKRRDIIPKTLQSSDLPTGQTIAVDELEVYETGEMQSFKSDFSEVWRRNAEKGIGTQWVVVFSPTGCKAMLECLGYIDRDLGTAVSLELRGAEKSKRTYIATIGPTTRDYLRRNFSIEPDVCAEQPSPEGVGSAIQAFMLRL